MADPQVAVRFAVKDAEVVRQALQNLGKDGETALKRFDAAAKPVPKSLTAVSDVISDVRGRAHGFAGSLGLVGTALLGLGPAGLAAGAAIGVVTFAIASMVNGANQLADKAGRLVDFSQSVGLTATKLQALQIAGADVGVHAEKIETSLGKASVAMNEFRRATGDAYEAVNRINPGLADQLIRAKDLTAFLDLLAAAWEKADTIQRNALSRAVFGKGGLDMGRLLGEIAAAGGLNKLEKDLSGSIVLTDEQAKKLDNLKDAAERLRTSAWDRIFSIGAENALKQQKEIAEQLDWLSKKLREISEIDIKQSVLTFMNLVSSPKDLASYVGNNVIERLTGRQRQQPVSPEATEVPSVPLGGSIPVPRDRPASADQIPEKVEATFNKEKRRLALLGDAITLEEQARLKELELAAAVEAGHTSREIYNRALDAFNRKQQEAILATRVRLGIADEDEIRAVRMTQLEADRARGFILNADEMAKAARLAGKEAEEQAKAIEVRVSDFPQLTRLRQQANDLNAQLDSELSGAIRGVTSDILDMAKGTKSASEAFGAMATKIAEAIAQAVLMKTVVGPLTNMVTGGLGLFGNGTGAGAGAGLSGAGAGVGGFALGGVFASGISGYSNSIVNRPTLFKFASGAGLMGERGPEAIIPLRRDASGRLGVSGGGGALPPINVINNLGVETTPRQERRPDGSIDVILDAVEARSASRVQSGRGPLAKLMPRPPLRG